MRYRYRYPFMSEEDASWVAEDARQAVCDAGGTVEVQGVMLFVFLPCIIPPSVVGRLALFAYDELLDDAGDVIEAA